MNSFGGSSRDRRYEDRGDRFGRRDRVNHRGDRRRGPPRGPPRYVQLRERKPNPIGDRCNPACPFFICEKRCLVLKLENGQVVPYCNWVGDRCIGPSCQYASCSARAMLPDGRCQHALKKERKEPSFEEEIEMLAKAKSDQIRGLLSRRGLGKDLESELL